jgi:PAS domain S-box-containing protein
MQNDKNPQELREELEALQAELSVLKKAQERSAHSEDAIQKSEERYRRIVSAVTDYIYKVHVEEGRMVRTEHSPACEAVTGYTVEEFDADPYLWFTMVAEADREKVRKFFREVLTGEHEGPIEHRIYRKDGSMRWVVNIPVIHRNGAGEVISYDGVVSDITQRKNAEEALKESEERWQFALEGAGDGVWDWDLRTNKFFRSRRWKEMLGYEDDEIGDSPDEWMKLIHPDEQDKCDGELDRHLSGRASVYMSEHRYRCKDGTYKWILDRGKIIQWDHDGNPVRIIGTHADITERKRAEEALKESEERFRTLQEASFGGISIHDKGVILDCNQGLADMTGYSPDELIGMNSLNLIAPAWRDHVLQQMTIGYEKLYDVEGIRKDGSVYPLEIRGRNIPYHGRMVRVTEFRDITERKRAAEALRVSEERFRSLIQNSSDIIVMLDRNGLIIYESPSVESILQYRPGHLMGRTPLDFIHPADREVVTASLNKVYEGTNLGIPAEFRFRRADGTWIDLEALGKNLLDFPGINGIVITARDVTDRKKSERSRLEMERRLLHAQKLESLGVMAGGIAHDFNNLLMAILGNLDLALLDLSEVSRSRPFISQALLAARRAADLTNQMLAYSGKGTFDLKTFGMSELVEEMARLLKASISKTVTLSLQLDKNLPMIMADPGQIQQIAMNLIVNAAEAIGGDPGIVTITTGLKECDEKYFLDSRLKEKPPEGDYVFLEVKDTGCGMDKETQERLFDPFFTTKFTGRGLGMAAVLGIVSGHKGAILVESERGRGTTIRVLFPAADKSESLAEEEKEPAAGVSETELGPSSQGMILVVDDEEMVLELCKDMVECFGFIALTAADGEHAVEVFQRHADKIDCVILDLTMPNKDGMATFNELRDIRSDVQVIISTGYDEHEVTQRFKGKGLAGFIKKPYQLDKLKKELQRVLKNKE